MPAEEVPKPMHGAMQVDNAAASKENGR